MMPSPSKRLPRVVLLATHLYHRLIRLGPEEFLQEYEEYMLSDFRRHCHEVYQRQGIYGLLRECSPMFIKAVVDMSEERALCQKEKPLPSMILLIIRIPLKIMLLESRTFRVLTLGKIELFPYMEKDLIQREKDLIQRLEVISRKGGIK